MNRVQAHHGIETALPLPPAAGYFRLEGWAFIAGATAPTRVRYRIGSTVFEPDTVTERPDVAAAFPHEPYASQSGFRFLGYPRFGVHLGVLEASTDGEAWHSIRTLVTPVSSHPLMGAFEKPSPGSRIESPARVEGWCFHPDFRINNVVLLMGKLEIPCDYRLSRPDVEKLFPTHPEIRQSGFITTENLPRGTGRLRLRAETACGRTFFLESELSAEINDGKYVLGSRLENVASSLALAPVADHRIHPRREHRHPPSPGVRNILFVLYGDFTCNSALHIAALANELITLGYDCVVAGPSHKESIEVLPKARFVALEFAEAEDLPDYFGDGCGPTIVHAWTPRENVRRFTETICRTYGIPYFVHLEDHEDTLLQAHLQKSPEEIRALSATELDDLVPPHLIHPIRAADFLRNSAGVTLIVETLAEIVPPGIPTQVLWPAADKSIFHPHAQDSEARRALGITDSDTVIFYHGNVHAANAAEVESLYEAVALLNKRGRRTYLIRTGRDDAGLLEEESRNLGTSLLRLGHLQNARFLPPLMRLADYFVQPGEPGKFNDHRFPSKLPEFFSIGRPVILPLTNLGKVVRHGDDAYVLPVADKESIAMAILNLHVDSALRERLSKGALAFAAEHFSWPRTASRLLEFYRTHSLLATSGTSDVANSMSSF
jgi:glycosyltransferase involved in cell wall biosynthesis